MAGQYIAIEGNIGAGKSTLATLLAGYYQAPVILEQFAENPFLPLFYKDATRYALPLELSFLADRYKQLTAKLSEYKDQPRIIADYVFPKSSLFAGINLKDAEYDLFQAYFNIINNNIPTPDVLIFLDAPVDVLMHNIKVRGRSYEQDIKADYLEKVQHIYREYIAHTSMRTIIVDRTAVDFLHHPEYLPELAQFIAACTEKEVYRFKV